MTLHFLFFSFLYFFYFCLRNVGIGISVGASQVFFLHTWQLGDGFYAGSNLCSFVFTGSHRFIAFDTSNYSHFIKLLKDLS